MHKISSDGAAVVNHSAHWIPIDKTTPQGVKMMLVSEKYGVAHVGTHLASQGYYTHWHPLPTFKKETP